MVAIRANKVRPIVRTAQDDDTCQVVAKALGEHPAAGLVLQDTDLTTKSFILPGKLALLSRDHIRVAVGAPPNPYLKKKAINAKVKAVGEEYAGLVERKHDESKELQELLESTQEDVRALSLPIPEETVEYPSGGRG